uniref:Coiled-coil-helix-coiled-coil-helix domain-containing protein 7 n=1 Tax=Megaselia scalaris TaxID=36166 RepID=T1H7F4_MEGSC
EQELSYKCLDKNNYDREKCEVYFANKNCRSFWDKVKTDRRKKGILPVMPDLEDRQKIKEEYFKTRPQ